MPVCTVSVSNVGALPGWEIQIDGLVDVGFPFHLYPVFRNTTVVMINNGRTISIGSAELPFELGSVNNPHPHEPPMHVVLEFLTPLDHQGYKIISYDKHEVAGSTKSTWIWTLQK